MAVELKAVATLDSKQFQAEISKLSNSVNNFATRQLSQIKGMIASAFSVGAVAYFGKALLNLADNMDKTAKSFGVSLEAIVAFKDIAARSSVNFDAFSYALARVRDAQGEAVKLSKELEDALAVLGISTKDFIAANPDKALEMLAIAYKNTGESAQGYAALQDILGKQVRELLPALQTLANEGLENIKNKTKETADGFKELAEAKQYIEEFGNSLEMIVARGIKALSKLGEGLFYVWQRIRGAPKEEIYAAEYAEALEFRRKKIRELREKVQGTFSTTTTATETPKTVNQLAVEEYEKNKAKQQAEEAAKRLKALERFYSEQEKLNEEEDEVYFDLMKRRQEYIDDFYGRGNKMNLARPNVDALQRIGGIVGGVSAQGYQEMAIAQKQAELQENIKNLTEETNKKLGEIRQKFDELQNRFASEGIAI